MIIIAKQKNECQYFFYKSVLNRLILIKTLLLVTLGLFYIFVAYFVTKWIFFCLFWLFCFFFQSSYTLL